MILGSRPSATGHHPIPTRWQFFFALSLFCFSGCHTPIGQCGGRIPQRPALNPFAITYDPTTTCADLPVIDAFVRGAKDRRGRFSRSQAEHNEGIAAGPGDTVFVSIYFNNGGGDIPVYTAKNVRAFLSVSPETGTDHRLSARLTADNAAAVESSGRGGDIVVHTRQITKLSYVPNTAILCITREDAIAHGRESTEVCGTSDVAVHLNDSLIPNSATLGDLPPGFVHSGTFDFDLKVEMAGTIGGPIQK